VLSGRVLRGEDGVRLSVSDMVDLEAVAPAVISHVSIAVDGPEAANFVNRAGALAKKAPGEVEMTVETFRTGPRVSIRRGSSWARCARCFSTLLS